MRMTNLKIAALAIGVGALGSVPASAAVIPAPSLNAKPSMVINTSALGSMSSAGQHLGQSNVEQVRRRGGYYGGRRHYRGYRGGGRWVAPAIIGGLIIGSTIAQSQAGYRDRWEMCADRYQSFSWSDGTFQPFDGPRRVCPYLVR
jgi:hypothetical protein